MQRKKMFYDLVYPWFVDQKNREDEVDQNQCRIPDLPGKHIRACFHGWVILSNQNNYMWSLWNPITSKVIRLPPLIKQRVDFKEYCLSSPPYGPSSIFLLTTEYNPVFTFCRLDNKRNKFLRWSKMSYVRQLWEITGKNGFLSCPTCYNGKVYALFTGEYYDDDFVIHVDIVVREKKVVISLFPFMKVPEPSFSPCPFFEFSYIKESCTGLFYIIIGFNDAREVSEVILFKLHVTSMKWEELKDLENAMFFVNVARDYRSVFYMSQVASNLGGYIHIFDKFKVVYSYHVNERTISISSQASSICFCTKMSFCNHILYRLEGDHGEAKFPLHSEHEEEYKVDKILVRSLKDDKVESNDQIDESRLLNLPFDVLGTIMENCVGVEYMNFRATCKQCYLAAPLIPRSNKATLKRLQTYSLVSAWLVVFDEHRGIITFKDPLSGDKYFMKTPQELIDFKIYCSSYGWLLMFNVGGSMLFYNPFTGDIRKLPNAPRLESCCFSSPPTSPDCMVVGFMRSPSWKIYIHFVAREPNSSTFHLNFDGNDIYSIRNPTYYHGDLYALCNERELYVFKDVGKEDYFRDPLVVKTTIPSFSSTSRYFLMKCDPCQVVSLGRLGESIEAFKYDDSNRNWEHFFGLRKHGIYICDTACLRLEVKTQGMEEKIYFPRTHNGKIVYYSRKNQKYHTFYGKNVKDGLMDFLGTTQHCYPHAWVEPSLS